MENKNFDWSYHIDALGDLPDIKMFWEKQFVSAVKNTVPKGKIKKILEVGCSNGRWLRWFKNEYDCEVFGLDNNPEGFRKDGIVNFEVGDCQKMPYQDNFFDIVFSLGLAEHFKKEEKALLLKEQARVLKPEGYLICSVPLLNCSLSYAYVKLNYDLRKGYKHFRTTKKEMERYFKEMGMEIIVSEMTGNIFESLFENGKFEFLLKNKLLSKILATEILIIGKKHD